MMTPPIPTPRDPVGLAGVGTAARAGKGEAFVLLTDAFAGEHEHCKAGVAS